MRILVCGSRDYKDVDRIEMVLTGFYNTDKITIIEGGARGADSIAKQTAFNLGYQVEEYPADWGKYGKRAGYIRNKQMLDEGKPDLVLAFYSSNEHSKGTQMMVDLARNAGVEVIEFENDIK